MGARAHYISAALITETGAERAQVWRLAAQEVEGAVISILIDALTNPPRLFEGLGIPAMSGDQMRKLLGRAARIAAALRRAPDERAKIVRDLVEQVIVDDKQIVIKVLGRRRKRPVFRARVVHRTRRDVGAR